MCWYRSSVSFLLALFFRYSPLGFSCVFWHLLVCIYRPPTPDPHCLLQTLQVPSFSEQMRQASAVGGASVAQIDEAQLPVRVRESLFAWRHRVVHNSCLLLLFNCLVGGQKLSLGNMKQHGTRAGAQHVYSRTTSGSPVHSWVCRRPGDPPLAGWVDSLISRKHPESRSETCCVSHRIQSYRTSGSVRLDPTMAPT